MLNATLLTDCGGREWQQSTANLPARGGFAFFVFRVDCDWYIGDHLTGLHWCELGCGRQYMLAGTFDEYNLACYTFCRDDAPHDIMMLYNYVHQKLSDYGYVLRGDKRQTAQGFYLV